MTDREWIQQSVEKNADMLTKVSDAIWEYAELPFQETRSAALLMQRLQERGFAVKSGLAGMPTCFTGAYTAGSGGPVVGFLGEYDALSGLSQAPGQPVKAPVTPGGNGHGCGHCALGAGALGAAIALKDYLDATGKSGTVIYFGCPAEEGAGSKQFMARAGLFDGVDFVYTWHPSTANSVEAVHYNAIMGANFRFYGLTSHAGSTPYLGRSALDACELMSVGCNYLREHVIPEARIHYAYIDAGGTAPNVVQDRAVVRYEVRAPYVSQVKELFARVERVAQGAAMMTDTRVECELAMAFTEYLPNQALAQVANQCMEEIGAPPWDEADYRLAKGFLDTYNPEVQANIRSEIARIYGEDRVEAILAKPLDSQIHPFAPQNMRLVAGSTDVGDASYCCPTAQFNAACYANGTADHSWQATAMAGSSITHKAVACAAAVLALAAVNTMEDEELLKKAHEEYVKATGGKYICPVGKEAKPRI